MLLKKGPEKRYASVNEVLDRALEKDPEKRYASVMEFAEAFEQACQE